MLSENLKNALREYDAWSLLGMGTFSVVYRVRERNTGRLLACKVVHSRELAEREKEFLQKAAHPLFPRLERVEQVQECWCIFMEYIPGTTLKELIVRRKALTGRQAVRVGCRLAEGLLFMHEQDVPVIYRDLKPENVMIQQDGEVRLIDLGCACFVEEQRRTRAGTRGYAAPEQLERDGKADLESDVYALGKLLQFAAGVEETGPRPVRRLNQRKTKSRHQISAGFLELLSDMTRKERQRRVPDMRIFLQRLEQVPDRDKKWGTKKFFALFRKKRKLEFYYQKNINRGT